MEWSRVKASYIIQVESPNLDTTTMDKLMSMSMEINEETYKEVKGEDCKITWIRK